MFADGKIEKTVVRIMIQNCDGHAGLSGFVHHLIGVRASKKMEHSQINTTGPKGPGGGISRAGRLAGLMRQPERGSIFGANRRPDKRIVDDPVTHLLFQQELKRLVVAILVAGNLRYDGQWNANQPAPANRLLDRAAGLAAGQMKAHDCHGVAFQERMIQIVEIAFSPGAGLESVGEAQNGKTIQNSGLCHIRMKSPCAARPRVEPR